VVRPPLISRGRPLTPIALFLSAFCVRRVVVVVMLVVVVGGEWGRTNKTRNWHPFAFGPSDKPEASARQNPPHAIHTAILEAILNAVHNVPLHAVNLPSIARNEN